MLQKGIHPTIIAEAFLKASVKAVEYLTDMSTPVDLSDNASLLRAASTSLNSKVIWTFLLSSATGVDLYNLDRFSIFIHSGTYRSRCRHTSCDAKFH